MKKMFLLFLAIILVSCSNPMDTKITKENYKKVLEEIRKSSDKETFEKVQAVVQLSNFARFSGKEPIDFLKGKSFQEHIDTIQENIKKEQANKKAKELEQLQFAKEENAKVEVRKKHLKTLSWTKDSVSGQYNINKDVVIGLKLKNSTKDTIDAFEGTILVYDKLNNELANLRVKSTSQIAAHTDSDVAWKFPTIDYKNKMNEIYRTPASSLKFKFEPTKILLKDGTEI